MKLINFVFKIENYLRSVSIRCFNFIHDLTEQILK